MRLPSLSPQNPLVNLFLIASLILSVQSGSFIYPRFNTTESCSTVRSKGSEACALLVQTIPPLLATGYHPSGEKFVLIEPFSRFYPVGTNPAKSELVKDISNGTLSPGDDLAAAESSVGDFQEQHVLGEEGYGEWKEGAKDGKLPSFCRFGGSILTSDTSKTYFEVWLPLPDQDSEIASTEMGGLDLAKKKRSNHHSQKHFGSAPKKHESTSAQKHQSGSITTSNSSSGTFCPGNFVPASRGGWNGRYLHTGNGGQRGIPEYDEMKQALIRMKIAVSGSNVGHFGSGGQSTWAINNVEEQVDFGHRGIRVSGIASQLITSVFFGTIKTPKTSQIDQSRGKNFSSESKPALSVSNSVSSASKNSRASRSSSRNQSRYPLGFPSYFAGCSTGGRQAFSLTQKSPELFDGVIAGSPVWDYNHLNAFQIHVNSLLADPKLPKFIPQSKYPLIHKAVLQACDDLDGVEDQVIGRPEECKVDFRKRLLCGEGDAENKNPEGSLTSSKDCLSQAQIENLEEVFKPYMIGERLIFPRFLPGTEDAWTVTDGWVGKPFPPAVGWFEWQVLNHTDPNEVFDPYKEVTPKLIRLGQRLNPGGTIQDDKNLTEFFSRGGKLMHYHGLEDQLNPAGISKIYYEGVKDFVGHGAVEDSYRLYFIPGMAHCRGGSGPTNFGAVAQTDDIGAVPLSYDKVHDIFLATFNWTEGGSKPSNLVGVGYNSVDTKPLPNIKKNRGLAQGIRITRKLCPYPEYSVYDGSSDPSLESSFSCARPEENDGSY